MIRRRRPSCSPISSVWSLRELRRLMERIGEEDYAEFLGQEYETLKAAINEKAWDGEWYARALSRKGNIGAKDSPGSKIYLNAQTWAVLADVAEGMRLSAVLVAVDSMEQDFGFPLNMPPYPTYDPHVGRMSGMLPGLFENGGVYCHATGFKILMDMQMRPGDQSAGDAEKNHARQREEPVFPVWGGALCLYQLLFHESGILWEILSVLDNRHLRLVYDGTLRGDDGHKAGL